MDAHSLVAGNNAFSFTGSTNLTAAGQLKFVALRSGDPEYLVQGNVDGDAVADIVIALDTYGAKSPAAVDFALQVHLCHDAVSGRPSRFDRADSKARTCCAPPLPPLHGKPSSRPFSHSDPEVVDR
jgi:hypothetical protein